MDQLKLQGLLGCEGLKAPRWRERAAAAELAARLIVGEDLGIDIGGPEALIVGEEMEIPGGGPKLAPKLHTVDVELYEKLLRQLVHDISLKDSQWQVRVAAVESATRILSATRELLSATTFAEIVWGVLATCMDPQPEVQTVASEFILQRLLSSYNKRYGVISALCDRFVAVTLGAEAVSSKLTNFSLKEPSCLDNLPDGEVLLAGITAAVSLQLLPLPTSRELQKEGEIPTDVVPLLVVVVAVALEDAHKRKSRLLETRLVLFLRCLGAQSYYQSLASMLSAKSPYFLPGMYLARTYRSAGMIDEDSASALMTINIVTVLKALSISFEALAGNESVNKISGCVPRDHKHVPEQEMAMRQIVEMLQVGPELTKTLVDDKMKSETKDFLELAHLLLCISKCIIETGGWLPQDELLKRKMVEDIILCCAAFAGGDGEYGGAVAWTSKELREYSVKLLTHLSKATEVCDVTVGGGLGNSLSKAIPSLISEHLPSMMPRLKDMMKGSSETINDEVLYKVSPDGSLGSAIVAAHQMEWCVRQLEHSQLGQHCHVVMPCALTALDHFSPEVKRQAMRAFIYLAQNMNPTELRWYKDVILDSVCRSLVGCGDLWPAAVKMAVKTVTRMEGKNPRGSWYGRIFSEMICELERQRDDKSRRIAWLQEILPQMEAMGLILVVHFKKLLPLLYTWLHAPDDMTCILALLRLQTLITHTWPRIPTHLKRIMEELAETYKESSTRKSALDVHTAVKDVFNLLHLCASPAFEAVLREEPGVYKSIDALASIIEAKLPVERENTCS